MGPRGSETTTMITGDVMELHHLIYKERKEYARAVEALVNIHRIARVAAGDSKPRDEDRTCIAEVMEEARKAILASLNGNPELMSELIAAMMR